MYKKALKNCFMIDQVFVYTYIDASMQQQGSVDVMDGYC